MPTLQIPDLAGLASAAGLDLEGLGGLAKLSHTELEGIHTEKHWPWCARELPDGLRCRALTTVLVQLPAGGAVERCADCARWHERAGAGRTLRALAPR